MTYSKHRAYIRIDEEKKITYYALSPLYRNMKRAELAEKIQAEVKWPGKTPELEVLEKKITEYRNTSVWVEDEPWSLGESIKPEYGIPADTTSVLLELWRYSLEIGYPFTLRHAKWVARLYKLVVTANNDTEHWKQIQILFFSALVYADRERVSQALGQHRFDTTGEDAALMIPVTEAIILNEFGVLPLSLSFEIARNVDKKLKEQKGKKREMKIEAETLYDIVRTEPNVAVVVHVLHRPRSIDKYGLLKDNKVFHKFVCRYLEIHDVVGNLSVDQQRAYAILVTCFSKGPKWDDLSAQDYLDIIEKFVELVSKHSTFDQVVASVVSDRKEKEILDHSLEKVGLSLPDNVSVLDEMLGVTAVAKVTSGKEAKKDSNTYDD
jgi:hypothetical protein